jgi:D-glycero-alpha-D-manno-heptose 1-phosphate guanylyltransferase
MAPVSGRPFLEYLLDYWIGQGVSGFVLSVGYRREAIIGHFGREYRGVPIEYAAEDVPLGTGGALLLAVEKIDERDALLINGDTFFEVDLAEFRKFHTGRRSDWTFSLFNSEEEGRYMAMDMDAEGRISSLRSGTARSGRAHNGGVYLFNPSILRTGGWKVGDALSLEDDIIPALWRGGARLYGHPCGGRFIDIGVAGDYLRSADVLGLR